MTSTSSPYSSIADLHASLDGCRLCADAGHHIEGLPVFSREQSARMMLIGQAPGVTEAEVRRPFNGEAGKRLFKWINRAGWEEDAFRAACYITAVTKCFPGKQAKGTGDRVPSAAERRLCRPWLDAELRLINPRLIIPVGSLAIHLFYPAGSKLDEVIGRSMVDDEGRTILPLPHPSGASRWHQDPANVGRIEMAIYQLRMVKADLGL
jgi:uracil-DNA glycosylase